MKKIKTISLLLLTPLFLFSQNGPEPDMQIEKMKHYYQEWLSGRTDNKPFVEYDPSPIALDITNPRFTWIMGMEGRNRMQTAYQILVPSNTSAINPLKGQDSMNSGAFWAAAMTILSPIKVKKT